MKIGQYKTYPAFTVELESVVIKRMEKIRSKQNSSDNNTGTNQNTNVDNNNANSHHSGCYFNSEENSADRKIKIETEKLDRLCLD